MCDYEIVTKDVCMIPPTQRELKWYRRFCETALHVAQWSKDPSTKCGAVIIREDMTIASVGYNGFPRGCSDADDIYQDREQKYGRVIHSELNAILSAHGPVRGYTICITGKPCDRCAAHIVQAGIVRVVYPADPANSGAGFADRWREAFERADRMFTEAGVEVIALRG